MQVYMGSYFKKNITFNFLQEFQICIFFTFEFEINIVNYE